jgi:hypothetical protein
MILLVIRPLPSGLRGQSCAKCKRLQSVWDLPLKGKDSESVCSLCVLYDPSVWSSAVADVITEIEASKGKMFDRDEAARLVKASDADDVVGVLALMARVQGLKR